VSNNSFESKIVNISENFGLSVNSSNINNSNQNCSYFNLLPISPTICHDYTTANFFNHNEMNVSNMLISNAEANVEEFFCHENELSTI
jgi:hypothetical protein